MLLLSAVSTAYVIGELTAVVALALVLGWLLLRVSRGRSQSVGQSERSTVAAGPAPALHPVAPPGMQSASFAASGETARPTTHARTRDHRGVYALAALVVAAALVFAVVRLAGGSGRTGPWETTAGREMKAGFLYGCHSGAGAVLDCDCVFARLTSSAPYDTPAGFQNLAGPIAEFQRTRDLRVLPSAYVSAVSGCRRQGSIGS